MSDNITVTEYIEETKVAQLLFQPKSVRDHEEYSQEDPEGLVVTFEEPMHQHAAPVGMPFASPEIQILEVGDEIGDITKFDEVDELMDEGDEEAMGFTSPGSNGLPGATHYVDDDESEEVEEEEGPEGDWVNDRNPNAFMAYILEAYPGGIPKHDGNSISKGEKVIQYLSRLNAEISEALRADRDDCLDIDTLERMRVNMIRDTAKMKNHIKKLQRKHRESVAGLEEPGLIKEATTPRIQLVMTPFERAITGILINSVVSAGKPFEEVYDYLKKKYAFTPREELAIMQLASDMGQPIFKDRGSYSGNYYGESDPSKHGVDFIKNYFA